MGAQATRQCCQGIDTLGLGAGLSSLLWCPQVFDTGPQSQRALSRPAVCVYVCVCAFVCVYVCVRVCGYVFITSMEVRDKKRGWHTKSHSKPSTPHKKLPKNCYGTKENAGCNLSEEIGSW